MHANLGRGARIHGSEISGVDTTRHHILGGVVAVSFITGGSLTGALDSMIDKLSRLVALSFLTDYPNPFASPVEQLRPPHPEHRHENTAYRLHKVAAHRPPLLVANLPR